MESTPQLLEDPPQSLAEQLLAEPERMDEILEQWQASHPSNVQALEQTIQSTQRNKAVLASIANDLKDPTTLEMLDLLLQYLEKTKQLASALRARL